MIGYNKIRLSVNRIGQDYVDKMKEQLELSNSIATKALYDSIKFSSIIAANSQTIKIVALPYLYWIDKGRKASKKNPPKKPPYDPLLKWVVAKGIQFDNMSQKQTAFVIQKSLATKDTPAKNIFQKTRQAVLNDKKLMDDLAKSAAKDIGLLATTILKDLKNPTIRNT